VTVQRIQGSEVEYGIAVHGDPQANPMVVASHVVNAYASEQGLTRRTRWDYEEESPLRDARGFDLSRDAADSSQLTDEDLGLANIILTNGARLYVDHAHPEYSSPEVTNPLDVLRWEKAGERVMRRGAQLASAVPNVGPVRLYKNNIDNKGASYGSHENYLMRRSVPFAHIVRHLIPFFVSRPIICGAGRVGQEPDGSVHAFQISQRADYIEVEVGLETTLKRPIINTRDEPHADPKKYRRLHVIVGDANLSEVAIWLKHGITSLVLAMIEDAFLNVEEVEIADPVAALHAISHDPTLKTTVKLADGRTVTALELQWHYLHKTHEYLRLREQPDPIGEQTAAVLGRWESILQRLGEDPLQCAAELDWVAKLALLQQYRDRDSLGWNDSKLRLVDLQYHDLRPEKGLFYRLERAGRIERLLDDEALDDAVLAPPTDTRAYFRGRCLEKFSQQVAAASWDSVIFDLPDHDSLQRVPMLEPLRGTADHVRRLFDESRSATQLFRAITGQ